MNECLNSKPTYRHLLQKVQPQLLLEFPTKQPFILLGVKYSCSHTVSLSRVRDSCNDAKLTFYSFCATNIYIICTEAVSGTQMYTNRQMQR